MNKQTLRQLTDPSQNKTKVDFELLTDILWNMFNDMPDVRTKDSDIISMEEYYSEMDKLLKLHNVQPDGDMWIFVDRINHQAITKTLFAKEFSEMLNKGYNYMSIEEQESIDEECAKIEREKYED